MNFAEQTINGWEENLATRGFKQWRKGRIVIEITPPDWRAGNDDGWATMYSDIDTGCMQRLAVGTFAHCKRIALRFMEGHDQVLLARLAIHARVY